MVVVRFRTAQTEYAIAVEDTREVRGASGIVPIPSPGPNVVGIVSWEDRSLTVVSTLGTAGAFVLIIDPGTGPFGLLVEEVIGVVHLDDTAVRPPPEGQQDDLVVGVFAIEDRLVLVVDAAALARSAGL